MTLSPGFSPSPLFWLSCFIPCLRIGAIGQTTKHMSHGFRPIPPFRYFLLPGIPPQGEGFQVNLSFYLGGNLFLGQDTSKSFGYYTGFEVDRGSVPLASVQFTRDQCSMLYSIGMGSRLNAIRDHREWDRSKLRYGLHALPYSVQGDQAKWRWKGGRWVKKGK